MSEPEKSAIHAEVVGYVRRIVTIEWPEQAEGHTVDQGSVYLNGLNKTALGLHPSDRADHDLPLLLQAVERLWDARQERLLAAQSAIPDIVWFVVIASSIPSFFVSHFNVVGQCAQQPVTASPGDHTTPLACVC